VALSRFCLEQEAKVRAHDPAIRALDKPAELPGSLILCDTAEDAIRGADAIVVATEWPAFRALTAEGIATSAPGTLVLDANRFLAASLAADARIRYVAVGTAKRPT
jgi:UDPglucose 6-dehydrogenase